MPAGAVTYSFLPSKLAFGEIDWSLIAIVEFSIIAFLAMTLYLFMQGSSGPEKKIVIKEEKIGSGE
jgi:hypothetical protein